MKLKTTLIAISLIAGIVAFIISYSYFAQIFANASTPILNLEPLAPSFSLFTAILTTCTVAMLFNLEE